ncbi:TetR/AcrR family transcriptional regulator [Pantoea agglomerans]|jgi:AcrR family transcriptional regulator|uniref:TetR/AcrR family transcriptional regulator n=1 Tax=Enterobacter agglomerans TaxID=549 RepID=UPI0010096978|nr:TetR/AcrR family transcriptional regulator [Pantoea agglomerans]QAV47504.1 TetR/AcrR family transcriptional regulator [Pantoea agglomerans]QAV52291.1 TetR/AcrR family transcriptional regulator [Pantoea agglomerans]
MRKIDPEKQEAKRRQILDAAVTCFARKGFHGTSTNEICAAAGMSPGNLFHYYPNKPALIAAIAEEDRNEMNARFARLIDEDDAITAIETLAIELLEQSADPVYARISVEIAAETMSNSETGSLFAENEAQIKANLAALLQRGIAKGQIDPTIQPALAATWLIALADGAVGRALMDPDFKASTHTPVLLRMVRRFLEPPAG